jgi:hypothetical protein
MKSAPFWKFATRLLRRKKLAVGTICFSIISAGGLAALLDDPMIFYGGIVAIGIVVIMALRKRNQ